MSDRPSDLQALFAEMKRRRVFRVMAVYGAGAVAGAGRHGRGLSRTR